MEHRDQAGRDPLPYERLTLADSLDPNDFYTGTGMGYIVRDTWEETWFGGNGERLAPVGSGSIKSAPLTPFKTFWENNVSLLDEELDLERISGDVPAFVRPAPPSSTMHDRTRSSDAAKEQAV